MRKMIFLAVAGFLWKKFQEKRAADKVVSTNTPRAV
jgi:hypothetical protein